MNEQVMNRFEKNNYPLGGKGYLGSLGLPCTF